jgi:hypothetical protein
MKLFRNIIAKSWEKILLVYGVLFVLLPSSPFSSPLAMRDDGVFLYFGWRILNGELPYRDIWDHKPPVVYYINALGLALTNSSRWGIWFLEFIALLLAALIGYYLIKKSFGTISAVLCSFLWLLTLLAIIGGGNLPEVYVLPLQFGALWFAFDIDLPHHSSWRYFLIGFLGAIAFLTKQTTIGIWIAIILYITIKRLKNGQARRWIHEILFFMIGSFAFLVPMAIFFGVHGALMQFWNDAFYYNFFYVSSATGLLNRLAPLINGIQQLAPLGLLQISMIGYVFAVILVIYKKDSFGKWLPLIIIGLIDYPIELVLVSLSGETYNHYYITLLPVLTLFAGTVFWVCNLQIIDWGMKNKAKDIFVVSIIGIFLWSSVGTYINAVSNYKQIGGETAITYIESTTSPNDYVLLWGAESSINFSAQRRSPTRFVYQYPLYQEGYFDGTMIQEFLADIIKNRPRLIIDTKNPQTPIFDFPIHSQLINAGIAYLHSHYQIVRNIGFWTVYEYVSDPP